MTYVAQHASVMPPIYLTSCHVESTGRIQRFNSPASAAWPTTNRIIYVPFSLSRPAMVYKLFWLNGATVGTNNLQAGVYDQNFGRLIAGTSTLSAGANICQFDNITDTQLDTGRYWMALWCNGTTATVFRTSGGAMQGHYYETNAGGLPTTGTPVGPQATSAVLPVFGLSLRASP